MGAETKSEVAGVLLAGGLSRRMGGGDKGLRALGPRLLIEHVRDRLAPQVGALVLNANGDAARFAALGLPVVADPVEGFVGPLAGVLAGMRWARSHAPEARYVATAATDTPFFPFHLVARLRAAAGTQTIALARSAGRVHPVFGLWPVSLADDLERFLTEEQSRKVLVWVDRHANTAVDFGPLAVDGETLDPFFNANEPDDLERAESWLAAMARQGAPA